MDEFSETEEYLNYSSPKRGYSQQLSEFVEVYKGNECLWNPRLSSYTDFELRDAIYQSMADQFNLSVIGVKNKINNLRSWFLKEQKKIQESRDFFWGARSLTYTPTNPLFKKMMFLEDVQRRRKENVRYRRLLSKHGYYKSRAKVKPVEDNIEPVQENIGPVQDDIEPVQDDIEPVQDNIEPVLDNIESVHSRYTPKSFVAPAEFSEITFTNISHPQPVDEIFEFCNSISKQISKLSPRNLILMQADIQRLVSNKRLEELEEAELL